MWANNVVRRSGEPLFRSSGTFATVFGSIDTTVLSRRAFSDDNRGSSSQGGRGQGGRGNGSSGRGNGGRGGDRSNNHNNNIQGHGRRPKKQNFSEEFLEPAARGELKNHKSGIPKLTGRKSKGHAVRGADILPGDEDDIDFLDIEELSPIEEITTEKETASQKMGSISKNSPIDQLNEEEHSAVQAFMKDYNVLVHSEEEEHYYWKERDYDGSEAARRNEILQNLRAKATRDADGNQVVEVDDETFAMFEGFEEVETKEEASPREQRPQQRGPMSPADDPAFQFAHEAMGFKALDQPPPEDYNRVLPLELSGPTMQDFVESMMRHPTKYAELRYEAPNRGSDREALADYPANRQNPSPEFVVANKRFIYAWGLPPLTVDGVPGDLNNPVHCLEIQTMVGSLFDVSPEQVSVASRSSAFVGFPDIEDHKFAVAVGPMATFIESPVSISKYDPSKEFTLAKDHPDALVLLENLPLGFTPSILATSLFPQETDVGEVYGNMSAEKIVMLSPNSAVVAMDTVEIAEHAISSSLVRDRLVEIGQHRVRYSKARRELVFSGTHGGPDGTERLRTLGPRLTVDGDTPTKSFFISHASSLYLRNLDPTVTKQNIADLFQPFCAVPRDVEGSTEFVTCQDGLPTGRVFVGFDEAGEAAAALKSLSKGGGRIEGFGPNHVIAKQVKDLDKEQSRATKNRPTRSEADLLDSLNNWEQHVDPEDLQELLDHGISMEALDEGLRAIRYHNTTFASMDQATRNETINPDKNAGGMYKDLVKQYVATLKDCISTPENPGPIYESLFFPDEEIDTEIFDREPERQEELRRRREVP